MPKTKRDPIRCFEGDAQPYAPFWAWNLRNAAEGEGAPEPELEFYGYISEYSWFEDDITPKKFKDELLNNGKGGPITVRINSGGGEMIAASVIRSILADYPGRKTVRIDGLCASAAVMVALSGDVIKMQDSAYMMVHNPYYSFMMGHLDAETLLEFASTLDTFKSGMLDAYSNRTGLGKTKLSNMLDAETWMTASQAVEYGFADEIITNGVPADPPESLQNALHNYVNVPPALLNITSQPEPPVEDEEPPVDVGENLRMAQRLREDVQTYLKKE